MTGGQLQVGFLFEIAGLSVTLAGFSGLVAAFRRGGSWKPIDSYRLRQIPEMGLATAVLCLVTIPISETVRNEQVTIQVGSGLGLLFTVFHVLALIARSRSTHLSLALGPTAAAGLLNIAIITAGAVGLGLGSVIAYEWFLILLLARPMLAFAIVFSDVGPGG